ncbi:MAG: hypothetical protein ACHREM_02330 [Polyangiales bacterium]
MTTPIEPTQHQLGPVKVTERPLLCSDEEIRAVLSGKKTQFRRVSHSSLVEDRQGRPWPSEGPRSRLLGTPAEEEQRKQRIAQELLDSCPWGAPGDRLWLRERWRSEDVKCDAQDDDSHLCDAHCFQTFIHYAATPRIGLRARPDRARITYLDESSPIPATPSFHWRKASVMPRFASRVTLELVSRRIERLQAVTEDDAKAEGHPIDTEPCDHVRARCDDVGCMGQTHRSSFAAAWGADSQTKRQNDVWGTNPWVWRLEVRRID